MAVDNKVEDLIRNQKISEDYPDDYIYHPMSEPFTAKVDGQVLAGMLMRDGGKEGAGFDQVALMTPVQMFEMMKALPDAKSPDSIKAAKSVEYTGAGNNGITRIHSEDSVAKINATNFLMSEINDINEQVELVALGRQKADIEVSSADILQSKVISIETDFQPPANSLEGGKILSKEDMGVIKIPQDHPQISVQKPSQDFNQKAGDLSPANTQVDEARIAYQNILSGSSSDAQKTSDVNREVYRVARYLSRDKNFDSDQEFKNELNEAISDLRQSGLSAQADVLQEYKQNIDGGMDKREARNEVKGDLNEIKSQVFAVHVREQEVKLSQEEADRVAQKIEKELQDKLETEAGNAEWISYSSAAISESEELENYHNAAKQIHSNNINRIDNPDDVQNFKEAEEALHRYIDNLKKDYFPDHKTIEERRNDSGSDVKVSPEVDALSAKLSGLSPVLEAAFHEKLEKAGVDTSESNDYKAAFAESIMQGVSEDDVRVALKGDPENASKAILNSVLPKMDETIGQLKQGLYEDQDKYKDIMRSDISEVVSSPEFKSALDDYTGKVKEEVQAEAVNIAADMKQDAYDKAESRMNEARAANDSNYDTKFTKYVDSFSKFPQAQRDSVMQNLEKQQDAGSLQDDQKVLLEALKQIQINNGEVDAQGSQMGTSAPSSAVGGFKP